MNPPPRPNQNRPAGSKWAAPLHRGRGTPGSKRPARPSDKVEGKLLVVFSSDAYDPHELLDGIGSQAPGVPLIGCSTAGEIATSGPGDASVVVVALGGAGFSVATAAAQATGGLRDAGVTVAACAREIEDREHRVLLLLTDGLAGDQQEVVRGAYSVVGAEIPLVGGCAGDDLKMVSTMQFHGDRGAVRMPWWPPHWAPTHPSGSASVTAGSGWDRPCSSLRATKTAS